MPGAQPSRSGANPSSTIYLASVLSSSLCESINLGKVHGCPTLGVLTLFCGSFRQATTNSWPSGQITGKYPTRKRGCSRLPVWDTGSLQSSILRLPYLKIRTGSEVRREETWRLDQRVEDDRRMQQDRSSGTLWLYSATFQLGMSHTLTTI